jgi:soluble lytic murein transglycosylase-like protein
MVDFAGERGAKGKCPEVAPFAPTLLGAEGITMLRRYIIAGCTWAALAHPAFSLEARRPGLDALIAAHAKANNLPESLVHRVVQRESRYNPRAIGRGGAMGLMQIKYATARALGYAGSASGLLDAETNLTYAVRYLAGAYSVANGDPGRAVSYYARGYYYDAKRRGMLAGLKATPALAPARPDAPTPVLQNTAAVAPSLFTSIKPANLERESNR